MNSRHTNNSPDRELGPPESKRPYVNPFARGRGSKVNMGNRFVGSTNRPSIGQTPVYDNLPTVSSWAGKFSKPQPAHAANMSNNLSEPYNPIKKPATANNSAVSGWTGKFYSPPPLNASNMSNNFASPSNPMHKPASTNYPTISEWTEQFAMTSNNFACPSQAPAFPSANNPTVSGWTEKFARPPPSNTTKMSNSFARPNHPLQSSVSDDNLTVSNWAEKFSRPPPSMAANISGSCVTPSNPSVAPVSSDIPTGSEWTEKFSRPPPSIATDISSSFASPSNPTLTPASDDIPSVSNSSETPSSSSDIQLPNPLQSSGKRKKFNKNDKFKARRILTRHALHPNELLDCSTREEFEKIQEDLRWARTVHPNFVYKQRTKEISQPQETLSVELENQNVVAENPELRNSEERKSPSHSSQAAISDDKPTVSGLTEKDPRPSNASNTSNSSAGPSTSSTTQLPPTTETKRIRLKHNEWCKARRILSRNATRPVTLDQCSSRERYEKILADIEWAKSVFPKFQYRGTTKERAQKAQALLDEEYRNPFRSPSQDGLIRSPDLRQSEERGTSCGSYNDDEAPGSSRAGGQETELRSFIKLASGRKIIGVIDGNRPDGKIPRHQWSWVLASLASVALEVLREYPGPPPSCTDAGWFQGAIKLIACDDDRSVHLYGAAVAKLGEIYPGAQLQVIDMRDIPARPWGMAWLPESPSESRDIMELISTCNPNLPIDNWRVIKAVRFREALMEVIFQISPESINYLIEYDGLLNYGFNKIHMKFFRTPHDALNNLDALAAAVDPPSDKEKDSGDVGKDKEVGDNFL